jgi:hypothetical protein
MPIPKPHDSASMGGVIDYIYSELGVSHRRTEIKGLKLQEVIVKRTLPVYSKYFPYTCSVMLREADAVPGESSQYFIPTELPVIGVIGVADGGNRPAILESSSPRRGVSGAGYIDTMGAILATRETADISSLIMMPVTTRFIPPKIVEILPHSRYSNSALAIKCVHPETLHTININMIDYFQDLALYDVLIANRAILEKFQTISSGYGDIQLNLDMMREASQKRTDLIEKFRKYAPLASNKRRWYFG